MKESEKWLVLQACWLPTLSRAVLQKYLAICFAGFEILYFAALELECLVPEAGWVWRKDEPPVSTEDSR